MGNFATPDVHKEKDPYFGVSSAQKGIVDPFTVKKERSFALTAGAMKEISEVSSTDQVSPFKTTIGANAKKRVTLQNRSNFKRISLKQDSNNDSNIASSRGSKDKQLSWGGTPLRMSNVSNYKRAIVPPKKINSTKFSA